MSFPDSACWMRDTRSRTNDGPRRFKGGARISANKTASSLFTLIVSKTMDCLWLDVFAVTVVLLVFQRIESGRRFSAFPANLRHHLARIIQPTFTDHLYVC